MLELNLQLSRLFLLCKDTVVGPLWDITLKQLKIMGQYLKICCMKLGEHNMKIKRQKKLVLLKAA